MESIPDKDRVLPVWDEEAVNREGKMFRRRIVLALPKRLMLRPDLFAATHDLLEIEVLDDGAVRLRGLNEL